MQTVLLISPYESSCNEWEVIVFESEEECQKYIDNSDLTKEHYYASAEDLAEILRNLFEYSE